ncbi:SM-20-related protein [Pseudoalteromonas luteoviolacea B = ATCC 29581]|nr:SM-20-related protein [Pseudoalteromonas luteoviolacea B = ATCC 29581]
MLAVDLPIDPFEVIATDLYRDGISISHDVIPFDVLRALKFRLAEMNLNDFNQAGIGRNQAHETNQSIRRDKIHWLDAQQSLEKPYLDFMQSLQQYINRRLFMGLFSYECHFAHYQIGDFYKKHMDAFRGKTNRVLTTVLYLNDGWDAELGGELVVYEPNDHNAELLRVTPSFGTLVTFLSDEFPHEVLPALRSRYSIAGWFRVNTSISGEIDPPR